MKGWMGKFRALTLFGSLALILSGCGQENLSALIPKGYGAEKSLDLIILTAVIMLFVLIIVMILYVTVLVRFRKKKGQKDFIPKQVEGNKTLETIWTVIPIVLLIIIAVPTVTATFDLADQSEASKSLNVEVTGNQYWWHFNYEGEEIQTSQDLYIPTGERVYLNMKSSDVIHSFWVPAISGKMDVNPENENTMFIEAYEEGVYYGKCAELCGPSHALMDFKIIAVSPEEFDQWVEDMKNVDPEAVAEGETAQQGQALFQESNCMGCHAIGSSPVQVGPNLTNFGERTQVAGILDYNKENLISWIMDPESIKPGNKMTGKYPDLSEEEASKIADYLMQLKPSSITPEDAGK
ncbi:cytochrome c oxidase subunit II [Virgibacillus necropolis]|uniref:Cytochrome c oxidase subunit 2 n=1 Tax=Virgibacillus necropolis TaxID=163877 RepID=A0A221ME24_9BACI|nr:cytochrome c oxidase subunit II [Virgibacillus necropolis]ASN05884.1 cytochrome c oxidase subunit II [Virgibacillus necropolis]